MSSVLLAPHNDDETLFAAFTCIRDHPHVIVVLRSVVQEQRGGPTAAVREAETAAAMEILGCTWEQWEFGDNIGGYPNWAPIHERIGSLAERFDRVYVPAFEPNGGNKHHNLVSTSVGKFDPTNVSLYLTYTTRGKSEWGTRVPYEPAWVPLKLAALACYESQAGLANCSEHFVRSQEEYIA